MCWFGAFPIAASLLSTVGGGAKYCCVVAFGIRIRLLLFLLCLLCCDGCGCVGGVNVIGLVLVMSVRCVHFWCVVGCGL